MGHLAVVVVRNGEQDGDQQPVILAILPGKCLHQQGSDGHAHQALGNVLVEHDGLALRDLFETPHGNPHSLQTPMLRKVLKSI